MPAFEYGDWDLVRNDDARGEFNEWATEIEAGLATDAADGGLTPRQSCARDAPYVLATMMVRVDRLSNADETLGTGFQIPKSDSADPRDVPLELNWIWLRLNLP